MSAAVRIVMFLVLAAAAHAPRRAAACTSGVLKDEQTGGIAVFRTMDFPRLPFTEVAYVPAGLKVPLVPVDGFSGTSDLGSSYTSKHSYACVTVVREVVSAAYRTVFMLSDLPSDSWAPVCVDGINTAGLGLALQWNRNNTLVPGYSGTGPSVDQVDLANYILANYATVAELKAAVGSGKLRSTWNTLMNAGAYIVLGFPHIPSHYHVNDATGASLVLQWNPDGAFVALDNPLGVLANHPNLEKQYEHYEWWTSLVSHPPYSAQPTVSGGVFTPPLGSYNQSDRFTRIAMLRKRAMAATWPDDLGGLDPLTPGVVPKGAPETNGALMASMGLLNAIWMPRGIDASSAAHNGESDWTIWATIRDHKLKDLYYRVANSPTWHVVHVGAVKWGSLKAIRYAPFKVNGKWALDATKGARKKAAWPDTAPPEGTYPLDKDGPGA
ncbi:hypothetical protein Rsub_10912 [Raphidocelis subcapitata]|uniref:Choloylglycine hydrolase/NAAA C-terminal domain-containing protein n=1 Tax=Raphidocelis subcapitata TaxID=307507 RepID=A0A2V0PD17_9CHLO|nr:hypothetical protein Rsub_10912 [Raphidocelis subcapitata]|eukprot:GBF97748.1 hypothetical protein Rsub_10912 [Raphidocelis subcapitata]